MAIALPSQLQVCFELLLRFITHHTDVLIITSCGFMFGSSILLPSLFTAYMKDGDPGLLRLTAIISTISTLSFAALKRAEILSNVLYTIPWAVIPVLYIVHSPEQSVLQLLSKAPLWIAIDLGLSTVLTSEFRQAVQHLRRSFMYPNSLRVGDGVTVRTNDGTVDPFSEYAFEPNGFPLGTLSPMDHGETLPFIGYQFEGPYFLGRNRSSDEESASNTFDNVTVSSEESSVPLLHGR